MPYVGNADFGVCKQHKRRPACIYAQSDQRVYVSMVYKSVSWQISTF